MVSRQKSCREHSSLEIRARLMLLYILVEGWFRASLGTYKSVMTLRISIAISTYTCICLFSTVNSFEIMRLERERDAPQSTADNDIAFEGDPEETPSEVQQRTISAARKVLLHAPHNFFVYDIMYYGYIADRCNAHSRI